MERLLRSSRYLVLMGVVAGLVAAAAAFVAGAVKTALLVASLVDKHGYEPHAAVGLVQAMDAFLIGAGLLIFALGLYELFVGDLHLPEALQVHDLDALKSKLASIIVLVLCVTFLERYVAAGDGRELMYQAISVAVVSAALIGLVLVKKG